MQTKPVQPKSVIEYPLPGAVQTHELTTVGDASMIFISQQSDSSLVKVARDTRTGRLTACARHTIVSPKAGLHGLHASEKYPGKIWATLQFTSQLLLIDPKTDSIDTPPQIVQTIDVPPPGRGPHVIIEEGDWLWTTCKDSDHVLHINAADPSEYKLYAATPNPIFVARHPISQKVYVSQDQSSKILEIDVEHDETREIDIPEEYGATPVGLITGPDENVWFVLAGPSSGAHGSFAKIKSDGQFQWFELTTPQGSEAGLLHLAFQTVPSANGNQPRLFLVASSIADPYSVDALVLVTLDDDYNAIDTQTTYTFPTQESKLHRVLIVDDQALVTELSTSAVALVYLPPVDQLPQDEASDYYGLFGIGAAEDRYDYTTLQG